MGHDAPVQRNTLVPLADARAKLGFPLASDALRREVLGNLQAEAG